MDCAPAVSVTDLVSSLVDGNIAPVTTDQKPPSPLPAFGALSFATSRTSSAIANGPYQNVFFKVAERLALRYQVPVGIISVGVGATTVADWNRADWLGKRFLYGEAFQPTAILWHQGEGDYGNTQDAYEAGLLEAIRGSRAGSGVRIPWLVSVATWCANRLATPADLDNPIASAQKRIIALGPANGIHPGPNSDLIPHTCHFNSQTEFDRYADAWYGAIVSSGLLP